MKAVNLFPANLLASMMVSGLPCYPAPLTANTAVCNSCNSCENEKCYGFIDNKTKYCTVSNYRKQVGQVGKLAKVSCDCILSNLH